MNGFYSEQYSTEVSSARHTSEARTSTFPTTTTMPGIMTTIIMNMIWWLVCYSPVNVGLYFLLWHHIGNQQNDWKGRRSLRDRGHVHPMFGPLSGVFPIIWGDKSNRLYMLISWHFISPKRIPVYYFNVDKEATASGGLRPLDPFQGTFVCPQTPAVSPQPRPRIQIDAYAETRLTCNGCKIKYWSMAEYLCSVKRDFGSSWKNANFRERRSNRLFVVQAWRVVQKWRFRSQDIRWRHSWNCVRIVATTTNFGTKIAINWLCVNDSD